MNTKISYSRVRRIALLGAAAWLLLAASGSSALTILSQGPLTVSFNDNGGRIDSLMFNGAEFYKLGTPVSDWGLEVGTDASTFVINAGRNGEIAAVAMTLTAVGSNTVTYSGLYSNSSARILVQRSYELVPGQNALRTSILLQNVWSNAPTLRSFDTFDPDYQIGSTIFETFNDRYFFTTGAVSAIVGRATPVGFQTTVLIGSTDLSAVIGAAKSNSWFSIYTASDLDSFFLTGGGDGEGTRADKSLDIAWSFALPGGASRLLEYLHCFGTNVSAVERTFALSTATNIAPGILADPQSQIVSEGTSVTLSVLASGSFPLRYQWYFNGALVTNATSSSLTFNPVTPANQGNYFAIVTNNYGAATSAVATLTVHSGPPVIDRQPTNVAVISGSTVVFSVAASGSLPLSFQWRFEGTNIVGATSETLTLLNVQGSDAGSYTVVVSNQYNSVTSTPAILAVTIVGGPPNLAWASGGHADEINNVAFSPDGTLLASACDDHTIKLWRVSDGTLVKTLFGHFNDVRAVAFSPDGTRLVSGGKDGYVILWNIASGVATEVFFHSDVRSVAFAPDGLTVASASGAGDPTIRTWHVTSASLFLIYYGHSGDIRSVAYSPDGALIASGGQDGILRIWRTTNSVLVTNINIGTNIYSVAWSSNGLNIAAGLEDRTVKIYDPGTTALLRTLSGHTDSIRSIAYSPDGTLLASGSWDSRIKFWNASSGALIRTISEGERVRSVAFSPNGALLGVGNKANQVRLRQVSNGGVLRTFTENLDQITSQAFSPDGSLVAIAAADNVVKVWRVADHTLLRTFNGASRALAFSHDGQYLAGGSADASINMWDLDSGAVYQSFFGHDEAIIALQFSPDDMFLYSASLDDTIRQWMSSDGLLLETIGLRPYDVAGAAFSPDTSTVIVSFYGTVPRIISLPDGAIVQPLANANPYGGGVAISPDGNHLALWPHFSQAPLRIFQLPDGALEHTLGFLVSGTNAVMGFSADSRYINVGVPGVLAFLRVDSGDLANYYDQQIGIPISMAISPGGAHYALGRADGTALIGIDPFGALQITEVHRIGNQTILRWIGGGPPYQVQLRTNFTSGIWMDVGSPTTGFSATNIFTGDAAFYRVRHAP
jgi:WD40 repeat protein